MKTFIQRLFLLMCITIGICHSQPLATSDYPKIGKPIADFVLSKIQYGKLRHATLKDFKDKWLVLDFFSAGCASCFESFPKISAIQKNFESDVEFILIGRGDKFTKPAYEKARQRLKLQIPVAYDSGNVLFDRFGITSVPHIIVLDKNGIVQAITAKLNMEDIEQFLKGANPNLAIKLNAKEERDKIPYDFNKPLLINGNGGSDTLFLFRSMLTEYNGIHMNNQDFISTKFFGSKVQLAGLPLISLYEYAHGDTLFRNPDDRGSSYGVYWKYPVLEVSDSTEFQFRWETNENRYNYSLIVPSTKVNTLAIQRMMQNDLENYFGYSVSIESRMMPCWKLTATENAKRTLISKASFKNREFPIYGGFILRERPIQVLIEQLWLYHQSEPPFIDATGISDNISIEVDAILTDFNDLANALKRKGLILTKAKKEMKVIIIRDSTN